MPFLKRLFISTYLGFAAWASVHALWRVLHFDWAWLALLPTTVPVLYMSVGNVLLNHSATTRRWLPVPSALAVLGIAGSLAAWTIDESSAAPVAVQAVAGLGYAAYLLWYSRFGRKVSSVLANGSPLPRFEALAGDGRKVSSRDLLGAPALLVFYRGNWCPICVTQVREVAARYRELEARGIQVVMVSPQSAEHAGSLARKFEAPLTFWVDQDLSAAKALGLVDKQGVPVGMLGYGSDTVLPTVIMTDARGIVFYNDQTDSYRVRPLPEDFLAAFEEHLSRAS